MREDLQSLNWEMELEGLDSVQTWSVIEKKLNMIIDTYVPKSKYHITKSKGNLSSSMTMLIMKLGKRRNVMIGTNT